MAWVSSFFEDYKKAYELPLAIAVWCRESRWELPSAGGARLGVDTDFDTMNGRYGYGACCIISNHTYM